MQPTTGRAHHRADLRAGRRRQHQPASNDPAVDALEDPLAGLPVDDLSDEDREDEGKGDGQDDGDAGVHVDADAVDDSGRTVPGRSVLLPLGAAVVLAVVGAVCLLPVRLPWEAPASPGTATTAAGPMTPSPAGNHDGGNDDKSDGRSASSSSPSTPASPAGSSRPALPPPASTAATGADPDPGPTPEDTPEDTLAGPVSDQVLQDLLTSSLPPERTITDPALLTSSDGQKLLDVAWQALAADVEAGGWTQPRQQAHAVLRTGRDNTQAMPIVVDVVVMWAALDGQGQPTERELSTVRVSKGGGAWAAGKITTASEGN